MFQVTTDSLLDEKWEQRDEEIIKAAGQYSNLREAGCGKRNHTWIVNTIKQAQNLMKRLRTIEGVRVSMREK